jgi:hypothetical protein
MRADLGNQSAKQRRIDGHVDVHVFTGNVLQRCLQFFFLRGRQLEGAGHLCGDNALVLGGDRPESLDHARHREQAAIGGNDLQKVCEDAVETGLSAQREAIARNCSPVEKTGLSIRRRRSSLSIEKGFECGQLLLDLVERFRLKRDIEKGLCVTGSNTGSVR